jgi:hypothetical protein
MKQKIIINMIACKACKQVLWSKHRHDFTQCECDNKAHADGGSDYLKRGAVDLSQIEELSIVEIDGKFRQVGLSPFEKG